MIQFKRYSSRWKYSPHQGFLVVKDGNSVVCECKDRNFELQNKHAMLISEAPELLHWLEVALHVIEEEFPHNDYIAGPIMAGMRDCIRNAKGGE